jgi:tRNA U34 5-methylaminomethyl-2-thiouridine-forming methyltransferase MnmC
VPRLGENYHSIHGAVQESEYIFIKNGFDFLTNNPLHIFEVGLGTGLNALLTAARSMEGKREVFYTSIEKYPLEDDLLFSLNHHRYAGIKGQELFNRIHSSPWEEFAQVCPNFNLKKVKGDIASFNPDGLFDLIYFDAFGPDKQPEVWTREVFNTISRVTRPNGILVTYSCKGEVKRHLAACGFDVSLLPGPPGKRHVTRAIKISKK